MQLSGVRCTRNLLLFLKNCLLKSKKNYFIWLVQLVIVLLSSFVYLGLDFCFYEQIGVLRKAEDAYPTGAPGSCSYFYKIRSCSFTFFDFVCIILVFYVLCCVCLLTMSGFCHLIAFRWFSLDSWFPLGS